MTTEICKHCNGWRGLHKWDTMQCPHMGTENENWQATTYEEADDKDARIAELEAWVNELEAGLIETLWVIENGGFSDGSLAMQTAKAARALLETK